MTTAMTHTDKVVEKRRALGRGLDSLLPGPRVVESGNAGGAPAPHSAPASHGAVLAEVQAQAARGDSVVEIPLELIDENPYQTRYFAKDELLRMIRLRLRWMNWRTRFG